MSILSENRNKLRQSLFRKLKRENAFWSYNPESVTLRNCDDETLIYKTLIHLDIKEINQLFSAYFKIGMYQKLYLNRENKKNILDDNHIVQLLTFNL